MHMPAVPLAKPPKPLNLKDITHRADNWKQFKWDWTYYKTASKINEEEVLIWVVYPIKLIGKEGQEMFETFSLSDVDQSGVTKVLQKFEVRCTLLTHMIYEWYVFNKGVQEHGESLEHYLTDSQQVLIWSATRQVSLGQACQWNTEWPN